MKKLLVVFSILFLTVNAQAYEMPKSFSTFVDKVKVTYQEWKIKLKAAMEDKKTESVKVVGTAPVVTPVAPAPSGLTSVVRQNIKETAKKIQEIKVARVLTPTPVIKDKNLKRNIANVPAYEFKKEKKSVKLGKITPLPLLNLGEEAQLDQHAFEIIEMISFPIVTVTVQVLPTPQLMSPAQFKKEMYGTDVIPTAKSEKIDIPYLTAEKRVTAEKINRIVFNPLKVEAWADLAIRNLSSEELKLLRAMILYDKKDLCHIASGIFSELLGSQDNEVRIMSEYHLGTCLYEMNLPTEAMYHLEKVMVSKHAKWTPEAIRTALKKVRAYQEELLVETVLNIKDEKLFLPEFKSDVNYLKAKILAKKEKYTEALSQSLQVPKGHARYFKAQYIASLAEYMLDKKDDAVTRTRRLVDEIKNKDNDQELLALAQMHLGRVSFQKGKYKDSMEAFQQISKNNNLWIQALTEQGWAQIQSKDLSGAIGNMHSIQSPFFDGVYKPESYIVRSIGYLSMCQYADAYKTLVYLEKKYQPWLEKLVQFNKTHDAASTYQTMSHYLEKKVTPDAQLLPSQIMKEAVIQKKFLNIQESINLLIDENSGYPFILGVVERDKRNLTSRKHQAMVEVESIKQKINIANVSKAPEAKKKLAQLKYDLIANQDFLGVYDFKMATFKEGEDGFKKLSQKAIGRVLSQKEELKEAAGKVLKAHFQKMAKSMNSQFENNELLKYEIFAGSGENLRYQVAGGKVVGMPKEMERKLASQAWDFDGEFWEDEIGHYKSALKNNCKRN